MFALKSILGFKLLLCSFYASHIKVINLNILSNKDKQQDIIKSGFKTYTSMNVEVRIT